MMAMIIKKAGNAGGDLAIDLTPAIEFLDDVFVCPCSGKSATKRAAIRPGSADVNGTSGRLEIKADNSCIAISSGNFVSFSASAQGSRSRRANAETT
ncbi:MAG: hypothetical protein P4L10_02035 [Acidobacteriaceae bacterium]|nr:hypothetical protein [Acidobacteriaceae bacterium]